MPLIEIDGTKVPYETRFSEEAAKVRIDSKLEGITVVIPEGREVDPEEVLRMRQDWVLDKHLSKKNYLESIEEKEYVQGEIFTVLGEEKTLELVDEGFEITEDMIKVGRNKTEENVREGLKEEARNVFQEKVENFSTELGGEPNRIYVRNQRTRWGSCSDKNNLSLNWRLILAPEWVLEYVVAHEMTHLEIKDHSEEFWEKLEELFPRYEEAERWLGENSSEIALDRSDVLGK